MSIKKQLLDAIKANRKETVSLLLHQLNRDSEMDPNLLQEPLEAAIVSGDVKMVRLLKSHRAFKSWKGKSNVKTAIENGNVEILRFLLQEVSVFRWSGWEYFRYAVQENQFEAIRVLLTHGSFRHPQGLIKATVEAPLDSRKLMESLRNGDIENTQRLLDDHLRLQYVVHKDGDDHDAVSLHRRFDEFMECRKSVMMKNEIDELTVENDSEMIDWLCESGEYFDWEESMNARSVLHYAAWQESYKLVERILNRGLSPNLADGNGTTPMHIAAKTGNLEIFRLLEQYGGDINIREIPELKGDGWWLCPDPEEAFRESILSCDFGETPLHTAAFHNRLEIIDYLLKKGVDIESTDMKNRTPLFFACRGGNEEAFEMFLANGASIHARDWQGREPLYEAAKRDNVKIVEILLREGADPKAMTNYGHTVFRASVRYNCWQVLQILLAQTSDYDLNLDLGGLIFLHLAAYRDRWQLAEVLLENGADVNARDSYGETPLHISVDFHNRWHDDSEKDCKFIRLLLKYGADVNLCDNKGQTPYDLVKDTNRIIKTLLFEAGKSAHNS